MALAALALRRAARAAREPEDVVDASFDISVGEMSIEPVQIRSEAIAFLSLLRDERPRRVLEVGTANGGTLYLLSWAAASDARLLSIDVREAPRVRRLLYRGFVGRRQRVAVRTADSHDRETRVSVERFFRGAPLDVLFIDGDHSYDGVRRDYELYAPLVRPGGLIAFHDIVEGPETAVGGVPRFWREASASLGDPIEFVESWSQGGYGIGVGRRPISDRVD
jgi:predicted O-methyltransferase YrrM